MFSGNVVVTHYGMMESVNCCGEVKYVMEGGVSP